MNAVMVVEDFRTGYRYHVTVAARPDGSDLRVIAYYLLDLFDLLPPIVVAPKGWSKTVH